MASLQKKGDSWHCQFRFKNQRRTWVIGPVEEIEARAIKAKVEYLLMRIKQHLIDLPAGMDIVTFIQYDGKPPEYVTIRQEEYTFGQMREAWIRTHSNGTIEQNTLATCKLHLSHFAATLGERFIINGLTLADLQRHVDRRANAKSRKGTISPVTIKKEVATLSGVWLWASRVGMVMGAFPGQGLRYPKIEEPPP